MNIKVRNTVVEIGDEGVSYGVDPGAYEAVLCNEPAQLNISGTMIGRDTLRQSMSAEGDRNVMQEASVSVPMELRAAGLDESSALQLPDTDKLLRACSMTREDGARLVLTGVTGSFVFGEALTNDTTSEAVGAVAEWDSANSVLYVRDLQSMPSAGDTISGADSGATVGTADAAHVYRPVSDGSGSVTARFSKGVNRYPALGVRGTFAASLVVGQTPTITFDMMGLFQDPTQVAAPEVTYATRPFRAAVGADVVFSSLDVTAHAVSSFAIDLGNAMAWRDSLVAPTGHAERYAESRRATLDALVEEARLNDYDPIAEWKAETKVRAAVGFGSGAGNRVRFAAAAAQIVQLGENRTGGIYHRQLGCVLTGQDNELMLIYS
jgi:hypothetical protein